MSFENAALVLAWAAILLLTFAMSGLLRQIELLRQQVVGTRPNLGLPAGSPSPYLMPSDSGNSKARLMCFVDNACEVCEVILEDLNDYVTSSLSPMEVIVVGKAALENVSHMSSVIRFVTSPEAFTEVAPVF